MPDVIWWDVTIEAEGDEIVDVLTTDALDDFLEVLAENSPVIIAPATSGSMPMRYGADLSVAATTIDEAVYNALNRFHEAVMKVGLPEWPIVKVEAITETALDAALAVPNFPNLLGVSELAELLGVSRQRASELAHSTTFPRPAAELASGPVWIEPAVLRFVEEWERRPGRPRVAG